MIDPITVPTFDKLFQVAPIVTIVLIIAFFGWWLANKSSQKTIDVLKDFVEYLKARK